MRRTHGKRRSASGRDVGSRLRRGHAGHDLLGAHGHRSMHERHGKTRKESPWAALFGSSRSAQAPEISGSGAASAESLMAPSAGASCVPRLSTWLPCAPGPTGEPEHSGFDGRRRIAGVAGIRRISGMGIGLLEQGARLIDGPGGQPKTLVGCAEAVPMASAPHPRRVLQWWLFRRRPRAAGSLGETARAAPSGVASPLWTCVPLPRLAWGCPVNSGKIKHLLCTLPPIH